MYSKEDYIKMIENNEFYIPLFLKPWWLDAVAEDGWDVRIAYEKETVSGVFPYCTKSKWNFDKSYIPNFTPYLGPWIIYPEKLNEYEKRSFEKKTISNLLSQLPALDDVRMKLHWQQDNALPYFWHGFHQTTHYTYVLEDIKNTDKVYINFKDSLKRQIYKAEKQVTIELTEDWKPIAHLFKNSLDRQEAKINIPDTVFEKIDKAAKEQNAGKIFVAKNQKEEIIAGIYILYDENSAYYLYGGYNELEAQSGAMSLLFWEAIQHASTVTKAFDFEGSRIEGVERFFRSFGGSLKSCHFIWKTTSPLLRLLLQLK
jgi:hypothetical protein